MSEYAASRPAPALPCVFSSAPDGHDVPVLVHRLADLAAGTPEALYAHGDGHVIGSAEMMAPADPARTTGSNWPPRPG